MTPSKIFIWKAISAGNIPVGWDKPSIPYSALTVLSPGGRYQKRSLREREFLDIFQNHPSCQERYGNGKRTGTGVRAKKRFCNLAPYLEEGNRRSNLILTGLICLRLEDLSGVSSIHCNWIFLDLRGKRCRKMLDTACGQWYLLSE